MIPFLVCGFGKSTLSNLVKECFGSEFPDIFHKKQVDYVFRYLSDLGAQSILLEFEYVDEDYLDDFSKFYVRRFSSRGHKCARLHFFADKLNHAAFDKAPFDFSQDAFSNRLQRCYLGFMVVKPLPKTFIGKTCLKKYNPAQESESQRLLLRRYDVNLFGVDLYVESIAFQEQDKVVSACATTAIWSALHALQWPQLRDIPSCSEITTNAINFIEGSSNSFPSKELSNKQILRSLDMEGLRHHSESIRAIGEKEFFDTVKYYIESGLPLILGASVYKVREHMELSKVAGHAVTVLGYKVSTSGNALYVHDDRLGPFARATFSPLAGYKNNDSQSWGLILQEKDDAGNWQPPHEILVPEILISATDKNVRIPLSYIVNTCNLIASVYESAVIAIAAQVGTEDISSLRNKLTFNIRLAEISNLKTEFFDFEPDLTSAEKDGSTSEPSGKVLEENQKDKLRFLTSSFARFQWVAEFFYAGKAAFCMLVDATEIPQGHAVSAILVRNKTEADAILEVVGAYALPLQNEDGSGIASQTFFGSFLRRLRPDEPGLVEYLNKTYGDLRAPEYLKESELKDGRILKNASARSFYEPVDKPLDLEFPTLVIDDEKSYLIWVITHDGVLLIGREINAMGHPCLTGFKPARIAGELKRTAIGWFINSKSGRYSSNYKDSNEFLENALLRFKTIFPASASQIIKKS